MILTVTIPDDHAQAVLGAFCDVHRYKPQILTPADPKKPDAGLVLMANPETPQQFVERLLLEHARNVLHAHRQSLVVLPKVEF